MSWLEVVARVSIYLLVMLGLWQTATALQRCGKETR
jgi:hypothetical protein